ncbi:MAG: hypothetical protein GXY77_20050 [Fibrobacter sp.]|nr:hypothetical protein [Fibrobacter sp.]
MKKIVILTIVFAFCFCEFSPLSNNNCDVENCKKSKVDFENVFPILDVFDFKGEVKSVRVYQIDFSLELNDFHDTAYVYQCNFNRCGMLEDEITFKKNLDTMQIRHYSYNNGGNLIEIMVRNPSSGSATTNQVIYLNNSVWISGTTYYHGVNTGLIFPTFTGILFPIMLSRR